MQSLHPNVAEMMSEAAHRSQLSKSTFKSQFDAVQVVLPIVAQDVRRVETFQFQDASGTCLRISGVSETCRV